MKAPPASSPAALRRMKAAKRRDTKPELQIRRRLHAQGFRYLVDARPIASVRRRADLVFRGAKVAVFVDGCFWHSCPDHGTQPKKNAEFWREKLGDNVRRDRDTDRLLRDEGWTSVRVWEHQDPDDAVDSIKRALTKKRPHCSRRRLSKRR